MTRRARIVLGVAVLFVVVNLAGAVMAIVEWELPHAGLHAALALLGVYAVGRVVPRRVANY